MKAISTDIDIPLFDYLLVTAGDIASGAVCAGSSPDKLHHGSVTAEGERGGIDKAGQPYVWVKCKYCGDMFKGYASDLSAAYDAYVQTLPATGYTSTGGLRYSPSIHKYMYVWSQGLFNHGCEHSGKTGGNLNISFDCSAVSVSISPASGSSSFNLSGVEFRYTCIAPIDGFYTRISSPVASGYMQDTAGRRTSVTGSYSELGSVFHNAGATFDSNSSSDKISGAYAFVQGIPPIYEIVPASSLSADTYNINTRPTSISGGNYGIVGDNGQITKVEDNSTIINETNNTYYNPATGQTVPITGWSYDYSDRSYKVTLESGDTVTVTYGDENITIQEGDTIYNVYYLIDGSGSETPVDPPETCEHTWTETSTTSATCIMPGSKLLTCTKCQQTKTETIPALGHNWQVKQTVTTQYDEEGNLTQQGYTIFECSRCHEQYKSTDGTIPPGGGSGTDPGGEEGETTIGGLIEKLLSGVGSIVGGIIKGLLSLLTKAVEALAGLAELFTTFVGSLVELWGGFTSFLSAVFPFLPEEFIIIIELGLILMIAAAVFRKFIS